MGRMTLRLLTGVGDGIDGRKASHGHRGIGFELFYFHCKFEDMGEDLGILVGSRVRFFQFGCGRTGDRTGWGRCGSRDLTVEFGSRQSLMLLDSILDSSSSGPKSDVDLEVSFFAKAIDPIGYRDCALDWARRIGSRVKGKVSFDSINSSRVHGWRQSVSLDDERVVGRNVFLDQMRELSE
jgi:hypothetical protein